MGDRLSSRAGRARASEKRGEPRSGRLGRVALLAFLGVSAVPTLALGLDGLGAPVTGLGVDLLTTPVPELIAPTFETDGSLSHVLLGITMILFCAKVAGDVAIRLGLPSVLGELAIGVLLGNLSLFGLTQLGFLRTDAVLEGIAQLGAVILLFRIGLKSDLRHLASVGGSSLLVALIGLFAPTALGTGVSFYFFPAMPVVVHVFVGAALCATSVGITARVLEDVDRIESPEGQIILGAAVIDDLLALVLLAAVSGAASAHGRGEAFGLASLMPVLVNVGTFLIVAAISSLFLSRRLFAFASHLRGRDLLLVTALVFCIGLAWIAEGLGLAPIVGAFFAGLALDETKVHEFADHGERRRLEDLVEPIEAFLVPVFFVLMGLHVDLSAMFSPAILVFSLALTAVAILGKQVCALGVLVPGASRLAVGIGMVPRGEVGLVFAGIGAGLTVTGRPLIDPGIYGALVTVVFLTTLVTPPLLVAALGQRGQSGASGTEGA